jgi:hypothetical protein
MKKYACHLLKSKFLFNIHVREEEKEEQDRVAIKSNFKFVIFKNGKQ